MNLNRKFCASNCKNTKCDLMLSYSIACAADKRGKLLSHADLSGNCLDYQPPKGYKNESST